MRFYSAMLHLNLYFYAYNVNEESGNSLIILQLDHNVLTSILMYVKYLHIKCFFCYIYFSILALFKQFIHKQSLYD